MPAIDVGSTVNRILEVRLRSTGALSSSGVVSAVVTAPDGATTTYASIAPSSTGTYEVNHPSTLPGRYRVVWTVTGADVAGTYTDLWDVLPADPRFAISLEDAREALNKSSANRVDDGELRLYLAAATYVLEDVVGPLFGARTIVEQHEGGTSELVLDHDAASITTVVEYLGGIAYTIPYAATPAAVAGDCYTRDGSSILTRRCGSLPVRWGGGSRSVPVWVTYVAGSSSIPANVIMAARELIAHVVKVGQQGSSRPMGGGGVSDDFTTTPSGYLVPRRVLSWLNADDRPPTIA